LDFGDKSSKAINCTGNNNQKQGNKTPHTPSTLKRNRKTDLANKTNYIVVLYVFHNPRQGNAEGPILTAPKPTCGNAIHECGW